MATSIQIVGDLIEESVICDRSNSSCFPRHAEYVASRNGLERFKFTEMQAFGFNRYTCHEFVPDPSNEARTAVHKSDSRVLCET